MKIEMIGRFTLGVVLLLVTPAPLVSQSADSLAGGAAGYTAAASTPEARPGDRVVLMIWNEPEMSDTFTVALDGQVILPRLGPTQAQGVPIVDLQSSIRTAYAEFLRNPSVQIEVLRRISVLGEVREPGIYFADITMRLPDLIARAGGPSENANVNRVTVIRDGARVEFRRRSQEEMFGAVLHSGDQIIVHQRNFLARNPWAAISTTFGLIALIRQLAF